MCDFTGATPYYWKDFDCVTDCGTGYTAVEDYCEPCPIECDGCTVTSDGFPICSGCAAGYTQNGSDCFSGCDFTEYVDAAGDCQPCSASCEGSCWNADPNQCYCKPNSDPTNPTYLWGQYGDKCYTVTECEALSGGQVVDDMCIVCDASCDGACDETGPWGCTEGCVAGSDNPYFIEAYGEKGCFAECMGG